MWLALLFLIAGSFVLVLYMRREHRRVKRWKNTLSLDKHFAVFQQLYANIDGFALSKAERIQGDAFEYVYGEIEFESFIALLSLGNPNSATVFYDLGSGTGKAVLACAMVFNVKKSCGIELFSSLYQTAELQQGRLKELPDYFEKAKCIEFKKADILQTRFDEASLIFINATGFFGDSWIAVSKSIEQIKSGSLVISTSKSLSSELFTCLRVTQVAMSWGIVNAFIQQRL